MSNALVGTLKEKSLHASLKEWYAQPEDKFEVGVNGYVIDIVRGRKLIELQTRNFSGIRSKLEQLTLSARVHLVHPIVRQKTIIRVDQDGKEISRRKSPKRGKLEEIFNEIVYIPGVCMRESFSLEVLLVDAEEIWRNDGKGSWRRKGWSIADRRLGAVIKKHMFLKPNDYASLIPSELPATFSNLDLASALGIRVRLAQKMTYCLRSMDMLEIVGKNGNAHIFCRL